MLRLALAATLALLPACGEAPGEMARFSCGGTKITLRLSGERAVMRAGGRDFALEPLPVASGAKYAAPGDPKTFLWSKGEAALVSLAGEILPECRELPSSHDQP